MATAIMAVFPVQGANHFVEQARLPANVKQTCTADISSWFISGRVVPNAVVRPANSLDPLFADGEHNTLCTFFTWGSHMFLWLTSPTPSNDVVFTGSPVFYNVSAKNDNMRNFEESDGLVDVGVRRAKSDNNIELGQAGGGDVLVSQNNSLVYYSIHANNVFAMFATGRQKGGITLEDFPTTTKELAEIQAFSNGYGYGALNDSEALAMELKTSWVEADSVNASRYVTTMAEVPTFSCTANGGAMDVSALRKACPNGPWLNVGTKNTMLAMVGLHVVGSVNGHPEMVWATFEHYNNAPNNAYQFTNQQNQPQTVAFNSFGHWNFLPDNADKPTSIETNAVAVSPSDSTSTTCISNATDKSCSKASANVAITPVDLIRVNPFGSNELDPKWLGTNADLISLNRSVLSQLQPGDVRGNYIQTASIWTANGEVPPGNPYVFPPAKIDNEVPSSGTLTAQLTNTYLRGSMFAANTTMETFFQFSESSPNALQELQHGNCFACHGGNTNNAKPGYATDSINTSHIFNSMNPLPKRKH